MFVEVTMKHGDAAAGGDLPLFCWRPPEPQVLPFPLVRRRGLAAKQARYMVGIRPEKAAQHLERQLKIQRETLTRYGVAAVRVEAEVAALETQIRTELARHMARNDGAA
jgi:hypothetical protein